MNLEEVNSHLDAIEEMLRKTTENATNERLLKEKKAKFQTINSTIRQLTKQGIPVPDELERMRDGFIAEIDKLSMPIEGIGGTYTRLLNIVEDLGRLCRRNPRKDLYLKYVEQKKSETDIETLSNVLITVMEKMGGSGKEKSIAQGVEKVLQNDLTEADLDCPKGKTPRWKTNLKQARKKLIEKGVLTSDSKGKTWTLAR